MKGLLILITLTAAAFARPQEDDDDGGGEGDHVDEEITNVPDFVDSQPQNVSNLPGESVGLVCSLDAPFSGVVLIWNRDDDKAKMLAINGAPFDKTHYGVHKLANGGERLTIVDAQKNDTGRYTCTIATQSPKVKVFNVRVDEKVRDEREQAKAEEAKADAEAEVEDGSDAKEPSDDDTGNSGTWSEPLGLPLLLISAILAIKLN